MGGLNRRGIYECIIVDLKIHLDWDWHGTGGYERLDLGVGITVFAIKQDLLRQPVTWKRKGISKAGN